MWRLTVERVAVDRQTPRSEVQGRIGDEVEVLKRILDHCRSLLLQRSVGGGGGQLEGRGIVLHQRGLRKGGRPGRLSCSRHGGGGQPENEGGRLC